jgi:hypothetical protein
LEAEERPEKFANELEEAEYRVRMSKKRKAGVDPVRIDLNISI